ncbi:unnamed protein product [Litomosoides sigmodontis]|uniref:SH3 domain-containing protein n=1 Tax=Litomosoides sigmodontis TaxID=42156 RepID=A0A3P6TWZ4_LITSI|nr:unnamed protein product [Litomosoides sigmodontis]
MDPPVLRYQRRRKLSTPASTVQRINRCWTPNPQLDDHTNSLKSDDFQWRRSKSVGRYVESPNELERSSEFINRTAEEWKLGWHDELGAASCCRLSSSSSHHYSTNCFAQQRSKTQHFHLPPYRFQQHCKRGAQKDSTTIVPSLLTTSPSRCLHCGLPCHSLSWSEVEYLCKTLDMKGIHMESFTEQLVQLVKSTAIIERLDQSVMYLQSLVDCLEACGNNSNGNRGSKGHNISPTSPFTSDRFCVHKRLTNLTTTLCSFCSPCTNPDGPNVNGQSLGDVAKAQKLAKHEVLIRQKVEKLSEELLQQRNRRHGYVPSASPALQKNFDRFNGLINEFGRPKRTTTPQPISQPEVTSCTALFSFKAINPKELSFNRGDVIRMCRIVDMNWMEGEHNGQIGIFPSSYVQIDNNEGSEQKKLIALYPFSARNKNELSLKKGETLRHLRNIDANWIEGKNVHGQTGIFPKSYVNEACEVNLHNKHETLIPDRPKIPRITTTPFRIYTYTLFECFCQRSH